MEENLHRKNIAPAGDPILMQVVNAVAVGIGIWVAIDIDIRNHDQPTVLGIKTSYQSITISTPTSPEGNFDSPGCAEHAKAMPCSRGRLLSKNPMCRFIHACVTVPAPPARIESHNLLFSG
jgi:hypothetical protein